LLGILCHTNQQDVQLYASKGGEIKGFVHVLAPTPELWTLSLAHRTQIIYAVDIAVIIMTLGIKPGCRIVESGTGSGSLTTSFARAAGPTGHVFTFEFNADRVAKAQDDFRVLNLDRVVTVAHADACVDGFGAALSNSINAVFLDLPRPWDALKHAYSVLARNGTVCCFSPCIEQVQKTCETLTTLGFEDISTVEALGRFFDVQNGTLPAPPLDFSRAASGCKRSRYDISPDVPSSSADAPAHAASSAPAPSSTDDCSIHYPASITKSLACGSTQVVDARGHTSYLTFATLYRKKAAN
jgi:tRNA (adenine57-N1/adenine58-N1)-methyltransferase